MTSVLTLMGLTRRHRFHQSRTTRTALVNCGDSPTPSATRAMTNRPKFVTRPAAALAGSVSPRATEYNLSGGAEYADHAACRMLIAVRDRERTCSRR
jgi:hypothetical protein